MTARVSVIVLAYGEEPWLVDCVQSVLASEGVDLDVVLVDNGCTGDGVERLRGTQRVTVVEPGTNTGFAGGCHAGAAHAEAPLLSLVNSDVLVRPDALARLCAQALVPGTGIATASVRVAAEPETINSAGNPLHVTGIVWAGGHGEPAADHAVQREVACASGAALVLERTLWDDLEGFAPEFFAYHEDTDLSWRTWQRGQRVVYVPEAVVLHHYEFGRNERKQYLLERNRWIVLLTLHQRRTLLLLLPVLLAFELLVTALAARQGWGRAKVRGWRWLLSNRSWVRTRRKDVQASRTRSDRELAHLLTARLDPGMIELPAYAAPLGSLLEAYWSVVRRLL